MARVDLVIVMLISLVLRMALVQSQDGPNQVNWATRVDNQNEVVTTLQFYFHDTLIRVAQAVTTNNSLTLFDLVAMADDPLMEGTDPSSKLVGQA
ncbi:Dirigent protein 23 [Camellia lanceoleosa]|uniref:Dirigent protein 23 n=1 Tax=Camellia lanceoleosa TaxID=1840588 RepID=A0ACC0IRT9_9ERIC|nr:Dirigent protein 23 [Camellia lanceoleosa]